MKLMSPAAAAVVVIVAAGVAHGVYTDRWGPSRRLEQAVSALDRVPKSFGDWVGEDAQLDMTAEDFARNGIRGHLFRQYTNSRTREAVSVLVVCGRGGPVSVHTPDVCYAAAGYQQITHKEQKDLDLGADGQHTFQMARFGKPGGVVPTQLEIYWAWASDGRTWEAPDNPRASLARLPALYKLYVVREFVPGVRGEAADPCSAFLRNALPAVRQNMAGVEE